MKKVDFKFATFLVCTILAICVLWWTLELIFYGEIKPRIVDNIISWFWIAAIYLAYKFKDFEHRRRMRKCSNKFGTWWLRKPPNSSAYNTFEFADKIWIPSELELGVHKEDYHK